MIGGGNVAIDVARDSKRCGSDMVKVNMFCLESRETMRPPWRRSRKQSPRELL